MTPELVFTAHARRFLTCALLHSEDGPIRAYPGDGQALDILAMLEDLGLLEPVAGGWAATKLLLAQPWAPQLKDNPFRCLNG